MPLFEYRCTSCGHRFEKIEKFNAEPELACPQCGGVLERPLTAPGLHFKGAGWYVNDYAPKAASSSSTDKPATESKPASEFAPAAESKSTESKPASEAPKSSVNDSSPKPASSTP